MTAYQYTAVNLKGKSLNGVLEADSTRQASQQLQAQQLYPLSIKKVLEPNHTDKKTKDARHRKSLSQRELCLLTRQLATLVGAGLPIAECLTTVLNQNQKPHVKRILIGIRTKVLEGHSLANGLAAFPRSFPPLYQATIEAGEQSAHMSQVLEKLAHYIESQQRMGQKIRQALIYPCLMTTVASAVVLFLMMYVVPNIIDVFKQTGEQLPLLTTFLLSITHTLRHEGLYLFTGLFLLSGLAYKALQHTPIKHAWHQILTRLPLLGSMLITINSARFLRTFGILFAASVPVLDSMKSASKLVSLLPMAQKIQQAIESVREGMSIHQSLENTGYFSPMCIQLITSGESTGQLEALLMKASDNQDQDVSLLLENALTLFEPLLILFMGSVVLFIVLAVLLPIFDLNQQFPI